MALNGYIVNTTVTVTWDGVSVRIPRGTVIDSPAPSGSNLANLITSGKLTALTAQMQAGNPGIFEPVQSTVVNDGASYNPGQN